MNGSEITLILTPDDPCQTEITLSGELLYKSVTEHSADNSNTLTQICDSKGVDIASLSWGVGTPDRVKIRNNKERSIVDWMKKSSVPFKEYVAIDHRSSSIILHVSYA